MNTKQQISYIKNHELLTIKNEQLHFLYLTYDMMTNKKTRNEEINYLFKIIFNYTI